ncbi:hypothetical protein BMF94_3297 [Rhodotorula taiwanensis]|uniref:C3H1-type domain-containing protein n=1 Tax=Rhodotorula taiwanensis TaxID=741276 RepID=A0A2S5BAG4_9BASI|nr:hypothetical protein BMF94_3297 [Rhodotorula taiwanensis]
MVAAPETLVPAQQEAAAVPRVDQAAQVNGSVKDVAAAQNGPSVNEPVSPAAESTASPASPANLPPAEVARNIPCRFFPLGQCKYGEHCIFSHGIPGTAGSPGVPPSPSVAAQIVPGSGSNGQHGHGQQRQEHSFAQASSSSSYQQQRHGGVHAQQQPPHHFMPQMMPVSMEQAAAYGAMPMYYPDQAAGLEYGYPPQVAFGGPQPGYYYPPQFAGYPPAGAAGQFGGFVPQPYYNPVAAPPAPHQQQHQQQQQAIGSPVEHSIAAVSPPPAAVSPEAQLNAAAATASTSTSPAPAADNVESSPTVAEASAVEADSVVDATAVPPPPPVASLHTFFQTGPPVNGMPPAMLAPNGAGAPFNKGGPRANGPMGPRRSIGGPNAGPIPNGLHGKRASFGGARPPCSFFEANRCRHGDKCAFVHLLPDGSDARGLGRGLIGIDGRTEHPEATGGMPPAWLATQKALKAANQTARKQLEAGAILNGGYSYRERMSTQPQPTSQQAPTTAAPQEQQQQAKAPEASAASEQQSQPETSEAPATAPVQQLQQPQVPHAPVQHVQQQQQQRNGAPAPGSAAPQLVAAINGLTRRIPPAHLNKQHQHQHQHQGQHQGPAGPKQNQHQNGPKQQQQQQPPRAQRIPSGENDFPALSSAGPSSPIIEKEGFAAALAAPAPAPAPAPAAAMPTPAPVAEKQEAVLKPTSPSVDETEGFVMVSHSDAGVTAPEKQAASTEEAPAAPTPAPAAAAPRPKLIGGWASAAARGASVAVPEKPKQRAFSPVVVNRSADAKEAASKADKDDKAAAPATAASSNAAKKDSREKVDEDGFVRQQPKRKGGAHKAAKAAQQQQQQQQPVAIKA